MPVPSLWSVTPLAVSGARELRRILFEGTSEEIGAFADLANAAEELNLIALFHACYTKHTTLHAEASKELHRATDVAALLEGLVDVGLRPGIAVRALKDAEAALRRLQESRRKMKLESIAANALGVIAQEAEASKAVECKRDSTPREDGDRHRDTQPGGAMAVAARLCFSTEVGPQVETGLSI